MFLKNMILIAVTVSGLTNFAVAKTEPNRNAPKGGVMNYNFGAEPESLHPIMSGDIYEAFFSEFVHDTLCANNPETYEFVPRLAERWEISKDGLMFTFFLRKDAFFHNGENVTADDVKFSLEAIREPKHQALNTMPYVEKLAKVEVIDSHTIRFTASEKYFKNMESICGIIKVIPRSVYGNVDKSVKMQKEAIGAGPYKMEKYDKGQTIVVKKFDKWYGDKTKEWKGYYNFDQVNFRITKDDNILIERLKKGDLDYAELPSVDSYLKAKGEPFGKTVFAKKITSEKPKSYNYIAFNFKDPVVKDIAVRKAFAHLVNRAEMNKKFRNGMSDLANGPVSVHSTQAADMKPIEFSPKKAQELLKKSGWADTDKNGVLDKIIDGKKVELKLTMIYPNKDNEKYWTMIKEDAKKAGIDLELKYLEWNSFLKTIESPEKFQMYTMAWGGGAVEMDPKQIWHSTSGGKGGSNRGNYANSEVDKLIDEGRAELDSAKRTKIFKKAYTLIAEDVPYVFMFNNKYEFYANSNKMKMTADNFRYDFGYTAWWSAEK